MINLFDVITLLIFAIAISFGVRKGFLHMVLNLGSVIGASLLSKAFGPMLGERWLSNLVALPESVDPELVKTVNAKLGLVLGIVIVFGLAFLVFHLIAVWISKAVNKVMKTKLWDRLIGALVGFLLAFALMFVIGTFLHSFAVMIAASAPEADVVSMMDKSFIFKFFY